MDGVPLSIRPPGMNITPQGINVVNRGAEQPRKSRVDVRLPARSKEVRQKDPGREQTHLSKQR